MKTLSALLVAAIMVAGLSACKRDAMTRWGDCVNNTMAGTGGESDITKCKWLPDD